MKTEAQKLAERRYLETLDTIIIRLPKEEGRKIRADAEAAGKSLKSYICEAIKNAQNVYNDSVL